MLVEKNELLVVEIFFIHYTWIIKFNFNHLIIHYNTKLSNFPQLSVLCKMAPSDKAYCKIDFAATEATDFY